MSTAGRKKRLPDLRINGRSILSPKKDDQSSFANCGPGSPRRGSPEPNCSICLGGIEEKSFANQCFHSFCKTCLFEWSKVKAECPVCRQPFDRIISNVKAMDDYEESFVEQPFPSPSYIWQNIGAIHRIMLPSRQTGSGTASLGYDFLRDRMLALHALGHGTRPRTRAAHSNREASSRRHLDLFFPWHTSAPTGIRSEARRTANGDLSSPGSRGLSIFSGLDLSIPRTEPAFVPPVGTRDHRRYIYDHDLWVRPQNDGPERESSASFYRKNPACIHRLVPWLNRELLALLDQEYEIERLLTHIKGALTEHDIPSSRFRRIVEPVITERTHHFLHELFHFARSRHDMEAYNRHAQYLPRNQVDVLQIEPTTTPRRFLVESTTSDSESSDGDSVIEVTDFGGNEVETMPPLYRISSPSNCDTQEATNARVGPSTATETAPTQPPAEAVSEENKKKSPYTDGRFVAIPQDVNIIDDFDNPTPGPSGLCRRDIYATQLRISNDDDGSETDLDVNGTNKHSLSSKLEIQSDPESEDSVQIVGYRKAIRERTPEIIDILSSSEGSSQPQSPRRKKSKKHRDFDKYVSKSHKSKSRSPSPADSRHSSHRSKHKEKKKKHKKSYKRKRKSSTPSISSFITRQVETSSNSESDSQLRAKNPRFLPSVVIPKLSFSTSNNSDNVEKGDKSS